MRFVWDPRKAAGNKRKHHISFEEAATVFADPLALIVTEPNYPERAIIIGLSGSERILFCVYAEIHDDEIRIISARQASDHERREYEEGA